MDITIVAQIADTRTCCVLYGEFIFAVAEETRLTMTNHKHVTTMSIFNLAILGDYRETEDKVATLIGLKPA
jgi:hypothetical protein